MHDCVPVTSLSCITRIAVVRVDTDPCNLVSCRNDSLSIERAPFHKSTVIKWSYEILSQYASQVYSVIKYAAIILDPFMSARSYVLTTTVKKVVMKSIGLASHCSEIACAILTTWMSQCEHVACMSLTFAALISPHIRCFSLTVCGVEKPALINFTRKGRSPIAHFRCSRIRPL
jgi:hypothetical protein